MTNEERLILRNLAISNGITGICRELALYATQTAARIREFQPEAKLASEYEQQAESLLQVRAAWIWGSQQPSPYHVR